MRNPLTFLTAGLMPGLVMSTALAAPADTSSDETPEEFVARHAGSDKELQLDELRTALAELEIMVVVKRDLRGADYRLEELRQSAEQVFEDDPESAENREAVLLGLVAHVELQVARGYLDDALGEFPELEDPKDDPEMEAWAAILADPRVSELHRFVKAKKEGKEATAPGAKPLVGLRPEHDEIDQAVISSLTRMDINFLMLLGERAVPALARQTLTNLDRHAGNIDPLKVMADIDADTAVTFMYEHLESSGFFWRKRVIRILSGLDRTVVWDTDSLPWRCKLKNYVPLIERLADDPEVGVEVFRLINFAHGGTLTPNLTERLVEALYSDNETLRGTARSNVPGNYRELYRPLLERAMGSPHADVRRRAAGVLADSKWNDVLASHVNDPDFRVRQELVHMIAFSVDPDSGSRTTLLLDDRSQPIMAALLGDPDLKVRELAMNSMHTWPVETIEVPSVIRAGKSYKQHLLVNPPPLELFLALAQDEGADIRSNVLRWSMMLPVEDGLAIRKVLASDEVSRTAHWAVRDIPEPWFEQHPVECLTVLDAFHMAASDSDRYETYSSMGGAWDLMLSTTEGRDALLGWMHTRVEAVPHVLESANNRPYLYDRLREGTGAQYKRIVELADESGQQWKLGNLISNTQPHLADAVLQIAMDPKRSIRCRGYAALESAKYSTKASGVFAELMRDPSWVIDGRERTIDPFYQRLVNNGSDNDCVFLLPTIQDPNTRDDLAGYLVATSRLYRPGGAELCDAAQARWFDGGSLEKYPASALRHVIQSMETVPANRDDEFLARAIKHSTLALSAVRALGQLKDPATFPLLVDVVKNMRGKPVWDKTVRDVLPSFLTDESAELLLEAAAVASDPEIRASCLASLESMREYFLARDYWTRRKAMIENDAAAVAELISMLDDQNEAIRVQAIKGLATFDAVQTIPRLIQMMRDPSPKVSAAATEALERLNRERE